uniref:non-specific serine/threonine protein kinase n=1 Tax=Strongyloides papillosus TaxID=174720 RepID=A0A0N5BUB7_STREA
MEIIGRMGFYTKDLDPDLFIRHTLGFKVPQPEHRPLYEHEERAINREAYEKFLISMHDEYRSQMYDQYAPNHLKFLLGIYVGIIRKKMVDYYFRNPFKNNTFLLEYAIGDEIGRGRACHVFDSLRLKDEFRVATKFIPRHSIKNWGKLDGYPVPMEIEMLHKVKKIDNVVQMLDWFEREDGWLIVMNRPMPIVPLDGYMEKYGKLSEQQIMKWIRDIIILIINLASVDVMHRDLHPSNMLVNTNNMELLFIDFGNAQHVTEKYFTECDGCQDTNSPQWEFDKKWRGFPQAVWNIGQLMFTMISGNTCHWKKFNDNKRNFQTNVRCDYYDLMKACLSDNEEERPTFEEILNNSCVIRNTQKTLDNLTNTQMSTLKYIDKLAKIKNVGLYEDYVNPILSEEEIEKLPFPYLYNHTEILNSWKGRVIVRQPSVYGMFYIEKIRNDEMLPCMWNFCPNYYLVVDVYNEYLFDKKHIDKKILPDKRLIHYKGYKYAEPMKLYEPKTKMKLSHPKPPIKLHESSDDEEENEYQERDEKNSSQRCVIGKPILVSPKNGATYLKLSNMKEVRNYQCCKPPSIIEEKYNKKELILMNNLTKEIISKNYNAKHVVFSKSVPLPSYIKMNELNHLFLNNNQSKLTNNLSSNSSGYDSSSTLVKHDIVYKNAECQTDDVQII